MRELRTIVCHVDDCGQVARPGYTRCWHHLLESRARGWWPLPTVHGLLIQIVEGGLSEEELGEPCYIHSIELRDEDGDPDLYYPDCGECLDDVLAQLPDGDEARYTGPCDGAIWIHGDGGYGEVVCTVYVNAYADECPDCGAEKEEDAERCDYCESKEVPHV